MPEALVLGVGALAGAVSAAVLAGALLYVALFVAFYRVAPLAAVYAGGALLADADAYAGRAETLPVGPG